MLCVKIFRNCPSWHFKSIKTHQYLYKLHHYWYIYPILLIRTGAKLTFTDIGSCTFRLWCAYSFYLALVLNFHLSWSCGRVEFNGGFSGWSQYLNITDNFKVTQSHIAYTLAFCILVSGFYLHSARVTGFPHWHWWLRWRRLCSPIVAPLIRLSLPVVHFP